MNNLDDKIKLINRRIGQLVSKGEREVARKYAAALTEMRLLLSAQFEKYEQGGDLTLEEMLKHDRLQKMMKEVRFSMKRSYKEINKTMERILGEVYIEGYHMTAWAVETATTTALSYTAVRPETLTAMLNNPVTGLTLNDRLERRRINIVYDIQQQVTQGLQKNESYATMAKRLKKELEGDATKAMRIVRTEGHRVQESAKLDAMDHANKNGVITVKTWNTMQDTRVRRKKANHTKLEKVTLPMDENFSDGLGDGPAPGQLGAAGSDINCRCFLTYSVEKIEKVEDKELENMTFDKWEKERLAK